jgi:hypothetical protein
MKLRRKIILGIAVAVASAAGYFGYRVVYTLRRIPEAYAAWDTGTLLVEYMKSHGDRWPSSWEDLLSAMNRSPGEEIMFRGARAGDTNYAISLRKVVAIDWRFDPSQPGETSSVTRPDGTKFPIVWQGADPNEMVRRYLKNITNANASKTR